VLPFSGRRKAKQATSKKKANKVYCKLPTCNFFPRVGRFRTLFPMRFPNNLLSTKEMLLTSAALHKNTSFASAYGVLGPQKATKGLV
jgi:hypothetical protein